MIELVFLGDPCPWCQVEIETHLHIQNDDGSINRIVVFPRQAPGLRLDTREDRGDGG